MEKNKEYDLDTMIGSQADGDQEKIIKERTTDDSSEKSTEERIKTTVKKKKEESHAKVETPVPKTVNGTVVNTLNVNVRRWADKDSEVVETLRSGDVVQIHGKRGNFYEVSTEVNSHVYIASEYLKEG